MVLHDPERITGHKDAGPPAYGDDGTMLSSQEKPELMCTLLFFQNDMFAETPQMTKELETATVATLLVNSHGLWRRRRLSAANSTMSLYL
jgi:hypothetical protein